MKTLRNVVLALVMLLALTALAAPTSAQSSIIDLGTLGGRSSAAYAVNNLGQVVGNSDTASGPSHTFLWEKGVMADLVQAQLVTDLSRDLVTEIAPEELPLFRGNSEAYLKNPDKLPIGQQGKDDMLGFGAAEVVAFVTPVFLPLAAPQFTSNVSEVLGFLSGSRQLWRRR